MVTQFFRLKWLNFFFQLGMQSKYICSCSACECVREKASEVNARIRIPPSASSRSSIKFINVTPLKVPNGRKEAAFAASSYSIRIWCCFIQWRPNAWAKNLLFFLFNQRSNVLQLEKVIAIAKYDYRCSFCYQNQLLR